MFPTLWMSVLWASETAPRCGHLPPPSFTPGSRRQVSTPPRFASALPKDFHCPPPQALRFLTPGNWGKKHHGSSPAFGSEDMGGAGCVDLGATPAGGLGIPEGRPDGPEWVGVTGLSIRIKNGLVSLLSETLLLGYWGCVGSLSIWEQNHHPRERLGVLTQEELDQAKPQPGDGKAWVTGSPGSRPSGNANKGLGYEGGLYFWP